MRLGSAALGTLALLGGALPLAAEKFLADDPLRVDRDDLAIERPGAIELSTAWDVLENSFARRPVGRIPAAANVNTLGEVPDSSWFENRIGARELSLDELLRGPGKGDGPAAGKWSVIDGKTQGITPGFTIRDERGDVYFVKFDPLAYPNLASSAELIAARFFHAFGYFVPEVTLAYFRPAELAIAPGARVAVRGGAKRAMTAGDLESILARVPHLADGRVRCVASKRIVGEALGPHEYFGTRGDDPNDLFPHESRRELRGYRVFSAWLNHDDSRAANSLDVFLPAADGRGSVKHYLIDFSSALGAGSDGERRIAPQSLRGGNEYVVDFGPTLKTAASLGLWERPWRKVKYRVYPEVGRIEAEFFDPDAWRPEYPNPAFERMQPADAFWAARIVARFGDEQVRALVHAGQFRDPEAERHLADTLIRRRDKLLACYLRAMDPLVEFSLAGEPDAPELVFANLGERVGLGKAEGYSYEWFTLENRTGALDRLPAQGEAREPRVALPPGSHSYVMVRLRTRAAAIPAWNKRVDVYVSKEGGMPRIVGIEREE